MAVTGSLGTEPDRRTYGVGITVDVPLWNWNAGRIAQAEAQLAAGRKQAESAEREVDASVLQAQAHTGRGGDGKIFVSEIADVIKIRTGEHGE